MVKHRAVLAILGIPMSLNDIMEVKVTEVMTKPLPDVRKKGALALRGLGEIMQALKWADCVALGPGLGQHFETVELVRRLVTRIELSMVIDADGLNAISKDSSILNQAKAPLILTDHRALHHILHRAAHARQRVCRFVRLLVCPAL
mgnify:CR=1 FL=1